MFILEYCYYFLVVLFTPGFNVCLNQPMNFLFIGYSHPKWKYSNQIIGFNINLVLLNSASRVTNSSSHIVQHSNGNSAEGMQSEINSLKTFIYEHIATSPQKLLMQISRLVWTGVFVETTHVHILLFCIPPSYIDLLVIFCSPRCQIRYGFWRKVTSTKDHYNALDELTF